MSPPKQREWSLACRLSQWMLVLVVVPVLLALLAGYLFLHGYVAHQLEGLVHEELEETVVSLRRCESPEKDLPAITAELASQHPEVVLARRVFDRKTTKVIGEYGDPSILTQDLPSTTCAEQITDLGDGLLARSILAPRDLIVGLMLDGSRQVAPIAGATAAPSR